MLRRLTREYDAEYAPFYREMMDILNLGEYPKSHEALLDALEFCDFDLETKETLAACIIPDLSLPDVHLKLRDTFATGAVSPEHYTTLMDEIGPDRPRPKTVDEVIDALAAEELRHFNPALGWEKVTFIGIDKDKPLKHGLLAVIDGKEVINCTHADKKPLDHRDNQMDSQTGVKWLEKAIYDINEIRIQTEDLPKKIRVMNELDGLMAHAHGHRPASGPLILPPSMKT